MNSAEGRESTLRSCGHPGHIYTDLLHAHRNMICRINKMDDDINSSLDAAMELIQTVRLSPYEPVAGAGESFAQAFLALHSKMTALDTMRQGADSLTELIEYREG
ncbi:hypothetical protein ACFXPT_37930 [Streptomyces goshikiensis]|uniref:hypothetical protein n=1 Tax=Streptomyces goshikiensis TaxID=1942 RepID=UPI0036B7648E